jgi:hypothetical protein
LLNVIFESNELIKQYQKTLSERGIYLNTYNIFILDNVSIMNEIDWKFYKMIITSTQLQANINLTIILNIE